MKQLAIIKRTPTIQLGHLYEHLFCMRIDSYFLAHHLYPNLDYTLDGRILYRGIIYISLELFTPAAIRLLSHIPDLDVPLDSQAMGIAASQLIAEKEMPFDGHGIDIVRKELEALHAQPWEAVDEVGLIDTKGFRRKEGVFNIAEGNPLPARQLTVAIMLDPAIVANHRELLPLFRQFAQLAMASLRAALPNIHGYYSVRDKFRSEKGYAELVNVFNVPHGDDTSIGDVMTTCRQTAEDMYQHGTFARMTQELRDVSLLDQSNLAPDEIKNFEDTGVFIGSAGWKEIANDKNRDLLLQNISVEVRSGGNKSRVSIV
ncbi:hypothetical protein [Streptomyces sp. NPDC057509]|uniref:hypothetical protein n=1 Tax=Streptomyces sp. NPDC057509 TaxID=3346152 RepID=UPI0036B14A4A